MDIAHMFCIPIIAKDTGEALQKVAVANTLADILEIRLDLMDSFDLRPIIRASQRPILATYRSRKEGGKGSEDPQTRVDHAVAAIQEGADLVDVELSLPPKWREQIFDEKGGSDIVISTHRVNGTPSRLDLEKILNDSAATGADFVKIVTRAETWADNLRVLELIPKAQDRGIDITAFCMGPMGRISRIFSHLMGAHLTFTSLEVGQESASGQISVREMKTILGMLSP
jgi:3-dehydroquinate dehydratase-1